MKNKILLFGILLIIAVGYVSACRKAGQWLVKEDVLLHSDAIVILMGSIADRVLQATDIYKQKVADKVIIVRESMGAYRALEARGAHIISSTAQVLDALIAMGIPPDSIIILPGDATSTQMEAIIIKEYLADKPDIDTLLLVSSSPHTRRAAMIFKSVFREAEEEVNVLCSPSTYTNFNAEKWWRSKENIQTVFLEFVKIANFELFERRHFKQAVGSRQ